MVILAIDLPASVNPTKVEVVPPSKPGLGMATDWLVPSLKVIDLPAFCTPLRDNDPGFRPRAHIFVDFKAPWFEITNALLLCATKPTPTY
jgi:hypothetical protein